MSEIKLTVRPFKMGTDKEAALKPLEEASEVRAAWQKIDECGIHEQCRDCDLHSTCEAIFALADEIADTIQASCNLAARYDIDLQAAMERCEKRNRARGRYPMEDEDAKPCGIYDGDNRGCGGDCGAVPVGVGYLREKSPEEMSTTELIETLKATFLLSSACANTLGADWCEGFDDCYECRKRMYGLLKTAYEREKKDILREEFQLSSVIGRRDKEIERLKKEIADLTHERDGLRNRLAELNEAGITSLHRLLRETLGEAKNVTHNARVYIDKQRGSKDEHCGSSGSIGRNHGVDCGVERAGERVLSEEPPAQEMSEREAAIERLRELELTEENMSLYKIVCAVLGHEPATWWRKEDRAELCDKLIELLSDGE